MEKDQEQIKVITCTAFRQMMELKGNVLDLLKKKKIPRGDKVQSIVDDVLKDKEKYILLTIHARGCDECAIWVYDQMAVKCKTLPFLNQMKDFHFEIPNCNRFQQEIKKNPFLFLKPSSYYDDHPMWEDTVYAHPFGCHVYICGQCAWEVVTFPENMKQRN